MAVRKPSLDEWFLAYQLRQVGRSHFHIPGFLDVDITALADACRFRDCRHRGEPGCAVRAAVEDGSLSEARLASHRKLERELAYAERKGDARAEAEERKKWKAISKLVDKHMDRKYGGTEWR